MSGREIAFRLLTCYWANQHSCYVFRVWSVAYNKFHDQLMLTSSSDCQVNLQSIVSISTGAEYKYEGDASEGEQGAGEDGEQGDNVQE